MPERGVTDFHTIQSAINTANIGDAISVKTGTYMETVTINKSLTLVGDNPLNTFITGITQSGAVTVTADGVNIYNFSISNVPQISGVAVTIIQSSALTIANNTIASAISAHYY